MTFVLGIDIGHSVVKLAHGEDTEGQPARAMILPATACRADEGAPIRTHRNPHGDGPCAVLIDGNTWIAGAPWRSLRLPRPPRQLSHDFPETKTYRALLYAGLWKTGRTVIDRLVTSLPAVRTLAPADMANLKWRLEGVHEVAPGRSVEVREAVIQPHPVGPFMDLRQGLERSWKDPDTKALVIDVGYFTVDWAVITTGGYVGKKSRGSSVWAVSYICGFVREAVSRDYRLTLSDDEIEEILRSGNSAIRLQNDLVDLAPYLARALDEVTDAALTEIRNALRFEERVPDILVFAGGGAKFFRDKVAQAFPSSEVVVPEDPLVSSAVGLWRLGVQWA